MRLRWLFAVTVSAVRLPSRDSQLSPTAAGAEESVSKGGVGARRKGPVNFAGGVPALEGLVEEGNSGISGAASTGIGAGASLSSRTPSRKSSSRKSSDSKCVPLKGAAVSSNGR